MEIVTKIAPIALALIMLGLGLGLSTRDFLRVINNPKDFTVGIICQLILLPIVAYILLLILRLPVELALGLMIIAAAPGGVTSNVLTKFANGDVALSISLTAVGSLISIFSVPFIVFSSAKLLGVTSCFNIKRSHDDFGILHCKRFCNWNTTEKMYFFRMWITKWNFSCICSNTNFQ